MNIIKTIIDLKKDINVYYLNKALSIATKKEYFDVIEILENRMNLHGQGLDNEVFLITMQNVHSVYFFLLMKNSREKLKIVPLVFVGQV